MCVRNVLTTLYQSHYAATTTTDYIDQHAIAEAAVAHYKGAKFDRTASLRLFPVSLVLILEGFIVSSLMMYFLQSQIHLRLVYLKGDQIDCDPLFANHPSHLAC